MGLAARALGGLVFLLSVLALALFGAAGTFDYSQAWVFLAVFGASVTAITLDLARANTFTSATIEVTREQRVISSGPYALVRHPMYAGALLMMLGVPLALASWFGLLGVPVLGGIIVWRLLDEEQQLSRNLSGYTEYCERVRRRLVPHVW